MMGGMILIGDQYSHYDKMALFRELAPAVCAEVLVKMLINFALAVRQSGATEDYRFVMALGKVSISKICHITSRLFFSLHHFSVCDLKSHRAAAFYEQA